MSETGPVILFHIPRSRSSGTLVLLEELGAPYELRVLNMKAGENRDPAYLAVNPMGKVPAIIHGGVLVTEQIAISIYLADLFPAASLAPPPDDPRRGSYLRWMAFYAGCFEPAVGQPGAQAQARAAGDVAVRQFRRGDRRRDRAVAGRTVHPRGAAFRRRHPLERRAAAWTTGFGIVPKTPEIEAYIERTVNRPAAQRARARDAELAAAQSA